MSSKNKNIADSEVRFTLRLPTELHVKLKERCEKTRRKLNSEIVILIERFVDSEEISVPSAKYIKAMDRTREQEEKKAQESGKEEIDEMYKKYVLKDNEMSQKEKEA